MSDPLILVVRPGVLSDKNRRRFESAGLLVIETETPSEVRLLKPCADVDGDVLLACAMKAMQNGLFGSDIRENFTKLVATEITKKATT
jgi:hypothetical protein